MSKRYNKVFACSLTAAPLQFFYLALVWADRQISLQGCNPLSSSLFLGLGWGFQWCSREKQTKCIGVLKGAFWIRTINLSVKTGDEKMVGKASLLHVQRHKNTRIQSWIRWILTVRLNLHNTARRYKHIFAVMKCLWLGAAAGGVSTMRESPWLLLCLCLP